MAYLPLILLLLAALFSGLTVLSIVIANQSKREEINSIFPIVREMEGQKARWARISATALSIVSALSIGGWVATQSDIPIPSMPELSVDVIQRTMALVDFSTLNPEIPIASSAAPIARVAAPEATATAVALTQLLTTPPVSTNNSEGIDNLDTSLDTSQADGPIVSNDVALSEAEVSVVEDLAVVPVSPAVIEPEIDAEPIPITQLEEREADEVAAVDEGVGAVIVDDVPEDVDRFVPTGRGGLIEPPILPDNIDDIKIGPIVFSTDVTDRRRAVDPGDVFSVSDSRIYAVFPYQGMQNGLQFSVVWYYQGKEVSREETNWNWGSTDSSFAFFTPSGVGQYEVEMKVNSETLASASFEILP